MGVPFCEKKINFIFAEIHTELEKIKRCCGNFIDKVAIKDPGYISNHFAANNAVRFNFINSREHLKRLLSLETIRLIKASFLQKKPFFIFHHRRIRRICLETIALCAELAGMA